MICCCFVVIVDVLLVVVLYGRLLPYLLRICLARTYIPYLP